MAKLIAIVAMAPNRGIGFKGKLPWHIPEEFKHFREKTIGKTLLMGRKTFEGLPKQLTGRRIIVFSSNPDYPDSIQNLSQLDKRPENEIWVCGGMEVYRQALPLCEEVFLTLIKQQPKQVDTFLPEFEHLFKRPNILKETNDFSVLHFKK